KLITSCWRPTVQHHVHTTTDIVGRQDGLLWFKDIVGRHDAGEFSMAVVQANHLLEDQSQLESGPLTSTESNPHGTFIGIYDGHGGPETARYINEYMFFSIFRDVHQSNRGCLS
ncbi:hypothetical protein KI387_001360, partial [Taxus chinensis]